jgi:Xaa-Pro aminopeptidase
VETPAVGAQSEVDVKLARVRAYLSSAGLAGVLLSRQDNFAWLTGGLDNHVVSGSDVGVASLLVTKDGQFALCDRIEGDRLRDEEIGQQSWDWRVYDWFRPGARAGAIKDVVGDGPVGADTPGAGQPLDRGFDDIRAELLPAEVARYREVGRICTVAMVEACQHMHQGNTEHEIAADLSRRVLAQGGRPGVVLVAVDERIAKYRHPIPTSKKLRDYAMVVLGGSKWGLQISLTRFVAFHPMPDDLKRKWADVNQIARYFTLETRPGRSWAGPTSTGSSAGPTSGSSITRAGQPAIAAASSPPTPSRQASSAPVRPRPGTRRSRARSPRTRSSSPIRGTSS